MTRWSPRRERFRALLDGGACVRPGSVFDPISARLADEAGFPLGLFAGSVASLAILGAPDLVLITLTEFAEQALRISRASELPLLVDADHGYGNALNARRTVEELEMAGVAAITIEDTALPLPYGNTGAATLVSLEEGEAKMRAALEGRSDPGLAIIGRTSALTLTGQDDAIARVRRYEAAGVDAVMLVGVKTEEQLAALAGAISIPLLLSPVTGPLAELGLLAAHRVRIALAGHAPFMAAVSALAQTYRALANGTTPPPVADDDLVKRVSGEAGYARAVERFLSGRQ